MTKPREKRTRTALQVRIWGMDFSGKLFSQDATTVDITPLGARIRGIRRQLHRGAVIGVACGKSQARVRVTWIGEGDAAGQIGVRLIDAGKYIWGQALAREIHVPEFADSAPEAVAG